MTLTTPDGNEVTFAAEVKTSANATVKDVARHLRTTAAAYADGVPVMYVADYVSPPLRRELDEDGISYLDTTGWVSLNSSDPPVLIRLEGAAKPPRPRETKATTRLTGHAAARAIRHLLEGHPPIGVRELAKLSSSSAAAVSKLMPALVEAGAIERSEDGTVTHVRKRTLLDRWVADYSFTNGNGVVLDYIAPRGLVRTLDRIRERDDITVTGSAAAREYLPTDVTSVVPLTLLTLYTEDVIDTASSLGLLRADRDNSNVMITTPRDPMLLTGTHNTKTGLWIAPIAQVLADLLTIPRARLAQEAEQLIEILARSDDAWKE
jgi:DNA-binding transcriptional ArsR family regulator